MIVYWDANAIHKYHKREYVGTTSGLCWCRGCSKIWYNRQLPDGPRLPASSSADELSSAIKCPFPKFMRHKAAKLENLWILLRIIYNDMTCDTKLISCENGTGHTACGRRLIPPSSPSDNNTYPIFIAGIRLYPSFYILSRYISNFVLQGRIWPGANTTLNR